MVFQSSLAGASTLGRKPEYLASADGSATPASLVQGTLSVASGGTHDYGPGQTAMPDGRQLTYVWSAQLGELQSLASANNHVRYTAPIVQVTTEDQIFLWVGSDGGRASQAVITVTIQPTGGSLPGGYVAPSGGQLTGAYVPASQSFSLSYSLQSTVTRSWMFASLDGASYTQVSSVDPVTASNRNGNLNITVPGSGAVQTVYFRLRTQAGTATAVDSTPISVSYIPLPAQPKITELPTAPRLVINGSQVAQPSVQLSWSRVNDSLQRDNVNYYEVERATNPDFSGSTLVNAGNTAPGLNIYENVFFTSSGLADNNTYYFRVRAVNNVGTGPWSEVKSIPVNIQDPPAFDASNPVFPAHLATGVTKVPTLECRVTDPDGDAVYCAFEVAESAAGPWRYFGHGGQPAYLNVTRLDPSEWNPPLKPNTHYYWRAVVHEEGRDLNYYNGTWPTSPVWEFTTENVGGGYSLSNVTWISGTLRPYERVIYRVTVTNSGNAPAAANLVSAYHVKGGIENPFAYNSPGLVPALSPGQSADVDVTVYFRDALFISSNGTTYDNILLTGANLLRFKTWPDVSTVGVASIDQTVTYANAGGPAVTLQVRGTQPGGGISTKPAASRGGKFQINANINDDIRTTRVLLEYRMNATSAWQVLDDYTGNTTSYINYPACTHSGPTVPIYQNGVEWTFPSSFPMTSTLQVKLTAYDDVGATTAFTSEPMTIYDGTLSLQAGATQFPAYRLGEQVSVPVSVTKAPGVLVTNLQVLYYASSTGPYSVLFNQTVATNGQNMDVPPVVTVTLPTADAYASDTAFLRVSVRGQVLGLASLSATDDTDGTFRTSLRDLPSPFHTAVNIFDQSYQGFPAGAWGTSEWDEAIALDWEGDTRVHALIQQQYSYLLTGADANSTVTSTTGNAFHHSVYDRTSGSVTTIALPAGYSADDLKVINGVPYVLLRNGTDLYWSWKSGSSFVTPQFLLTLVGIFTTSPEFVVRNGELHVAYTTRNNVVGGGTPATWRNRLMRLLPTLGSYVEQSSYLGGHLDYGAGYLNGDSGVYAINAGNIVTSTLASWSGNPVWFSSSNSNVVGAFQNYESDHHIIDFYSPSAVASRWIIDVQEPRVRVFSDVTLGVGQATNSSPAGEDGFKVVIRRNNTTGAEERVKLGSWGQGFASTARRSAINDNKWVAVNWNRLLAVGNMSGDIIAPTVQLTTPAASFTTSQAKTLTWTMSDNLGQIASVKVIKVAGGVSTTLATYATGTLPTSATFSFSDTAPSMVIRLEVYDNAGNRGVSEQVLTRNATLAITSFTAASYSVEVGAAASLNWAATPVDAFRVFTVLTRPQGASTWNTVTNVTGGSYLLDTALLSGATEVRVQSGTTTRDLPQLLTVTGTRFAFDESQATPSTGTVRYLPASAAVTLRWGSNQASSSTQTYSLLGRWDGSGSYQLLGATSDKFLLVDVSGHTSLEWKVVAQWQGQEFVSTIKSITLAALAAVAAPQLTLIGADSLAPSVNISWSPMPGVEGYVLFRRHVGSDAVTEVSRPTGTTFVDDSVTFGNDYAYSVASIFSGEVSAAGASATIAIMPSLPLGITFVNSDYDVLSSNANTVSWNAVLPAGMTSVLQSYDIVLRTSEGVIARALSLGPVSGSSAETSFAALAFNQAYVCEVTAKDAKGLPLTATPASLHFTTGFDNRTISRGPAVSVPVIDEYGLNLKWTATANSEFYDIFRSTSSGVLELIGRSFSNTFYDSTATIGAYVAYVVRARNGNTFADSARTASVMRKPAFVTTPVSQMLTAGDSLTLACSVSGILPVTYKWLLNNITVAGATTATLTVRAVSLANGGTYTVIATTKAGSLTAIATVFVVDKAHDVLIAPNTTGLVKAASGTGGSYAWQKASAVITDGTDYAGTQAQTLSVKTASVEDEDVYTCTVTSSLGTLSAGPFNVLIAQKPLLTSQIFNRCAVGAWFTHTISYDTSNARLQATKFVVSGLPAGLGYDPLTGIISGRPSASGSFVLAITASNPAGNSPTIHPTLAVEAMSKTVLGTYVGLVERFSTAGSPGGRIDLTTLSTGSYTGRLTLGGTTYSFTGHLDADDLIVTPAGPAVLENIITRAAPLVPVKVSLILAPTGNGLDGSVQEQGAAVENAVVEGWRNTWNVANLATAHAGYHTFATQLSSPQLGNQVIPQGSNYGSVTVTASTGNAAITGRVADDLATTPMTCSAPLGPSGEVLLYHARYYNYSGSIKGILSIAATTHVITGNGDWAKAFQPANIRSHWTGFATTPVGFIGGFYTPVVKPGYILSLSTGNTTGSVAFRYGYLGDSFDNPDRTFTVTAPGSVVIAPNITKTSLSINAATGFFSGSFTVSPNPRTAAYQGVLVRDTDGVQRGYGYFLLSDWFVDVGQTNATTKMYSGSVKVSGQ